MICLAVLVARYNKGRQVQVLTDGGDDDDGVEESSGEGPLDVVGALVAVPAAHLHLQQDRILEVLHDRHISSHIYN